MLRFSSHYVALAVLTAFVLPVRAADIDKLDCSAKSVPSDAAFYSATLRNKEQLDIVLKSKAWAKLWALPLVQTAWKKATEQLDQPLGTLDTPLRTA